MISDAISAQPIVWSTLTFLGAAIAVSVLGRTTDILRDSEPTDFGGAKPPYGEYRRPYSLAQTQMAIWICVILASFVLIWLAKNNLNHILNNSCLTLLGIGTGTALGAAIVEQTKSGKLIVLEDFKATLEAIKALPPEGSNPLLLAKRDQLAGELASENFLKDLLTDADGVGLHRFQALAWTVVLGTIFLVYVATHLSVPDFDSLTLAALGISGGTYLGFKIPEQPT